MNTIKNGFIITKIYPIVAPDTFPTGMDSTNNISEENKKNFPFKFRLYDGDQNLYFEGYSNDSDSEDAFNPLDLIQESYGVTTIKYLENGQWVEL